MPHPPSAHREPASGVRTRHVLIVEDEVRLREMLVRAVTGMEFVAVAVANAEAALSKLATDRFDIVLTDLNLPGMQGMELCETIRERWPDVQLLILTGYGSLDAAKAAIRLDVADFLTKPTSLGDLDAALNRALRRRINHVTTRPIPTIDFDEPDQGQIMHNAQTPRTLYDLERDHVLAALARHDGNREATAEELGISVRTMYYRLKEYTRLGFITPNR